MTSQQEQILLMETKPQMNMRKIGMIIAAAMILPLNINSSPATAGIFRPPCTANSRGVGIVDASTSSKQALLYWQVPSSYPFQIARVCYKKSWSLSGKCQSDDRIVTVNYNVPVTQGQISVPNLDNNSCYKFVVYGINVQETGKGKIIGEVKIKTGR